MNVTFDFTGAVAVVTGGTRGIGRGIAQRLLSAGAEVVVCGRRAPDVMPSASGRDSHFVAADVRHADQAEALIAEATARFGRLDLLVNNAGGSPPADALTASPRFSTAIVELNLLSALHASQAAMRVMAGQPSGGSIVQIASVSGVRPSPGTAAYGAAKAGLLHLTRSLAVEWGPHVRVNAIIAGLIRTEAASQHYGDEARIASIAQTVPLRRLGTPDDIADAVLFLASPAASYISGAALQVHGGGERPAFLDA